MPKKEMRCSSSFENFKVKRKGRKPGRQEHEEEKNKSYNLHERLSAPQTSDAGDEDADQLIRLVIEQPGICFGGKMAREGTVVATVAPLELPSIQSHFLLQTLGASSEPLPRDWQQWRSLRPPAARQSVAQPQVPLRVFDKIEQSQQLERAFAEWSSWWCSWGARVSNRRAREIRFVQYFVAWICSRLLWF